MKNKTLLIITVFLFLSVSALANNTFIDSWETDNGVIISVPIDYSGECWDCNAECCDGDLCSEMCFKVCEMGNKVFKDHCEEAEDDRQ